MTFSTEDILEEFAEAAQLRRRDESMRGFGLRLSAPERAAYDREYRAANAARIADGKRRWRAEHAEQQAASNKRWREANRAALAERQRARRAASPERSRAIDRAWHAANRVARNRYLAAWKAVQRARRRLRKAVLLALILHAAPTAQENQ